MAQLKILRWIAVLALFAAGPLLAQEGPPTPAPLPIFHAPLANGEAGSEQLPAAPTDRVVETIPVTAPTATEAIATATAEPQPVTLTAMITDGGQPIGEGVVWRVFNTSPDSAGQLALAAKSDKAVAKLALAPGNYVVHAAYGRAQASETITVAEGDNSKNVVLEAGGLRLNAAVTGDVAIPINLLRFDVFTAGSTDADRALVAQGIGANDILTVNAGTYHVISYFGEVNAVVRADLRVEPGQLTDATLYHRAAQISFKLVSEAGGEAIADVDWTVKPAGEGGATLFTNTGAFPSTVLQEGDYLVFAKRGDQVFNRAFEVQPGQPKEIEVLTTVY